MLLRIGVLSNLNHRDIPGYGRHYTLSIADNTQIKELMQAIGPYLPAAKYEKMMRWSAGWSDRSSATNVGIPMSFVHTELARRRAVTGRSKRSLGIDSGSYAKTRVVHRSNLAGLLYSERLEDLRSGDLGVGHGSHH